MPYYRIAELTPTPDMGYVVGGFCSGVMNMEQSARDILKIRRGPGRDMSRYLVFGATTVARMEHDLMRYNAGQKVCAMEADALLKGYPFGLKEIQAREADIDTYPPMGFRYLGWSVFDVGRLQFYRWLYLRTGLGEGVV